MPAISLNEASARDIDLIMTMEAAGFAVGHRERREVYERRIDVFPQGALLAYLGSRCVGCFFSEIWRESRRPLAEHFAPGHDIGERHDAQCGSELYISSMTIGPDHRGKGLGAQLFRCGIEHVASTFPQLTSALLLVNATWRGARHIYTATGFRPIERLPGFFGTDGLRDEGSEDGIVMRRPISMSAVRPRGRAVCSALENCE